MLCRLRLIVAFILLIFVSIALTTAYGDNPPIATIISPDNGSIASGILDVVVETLDENVLPKVELYINDQLYSIQPNVIGVVIFQVNTADFYDGIYILQAEAYDSIGQVGVSNPVNVIFDDTNLSPVADAGPDIDVVTGMEFSIDGLGSYDPDGTVVSYHWDMGDGMVYTEPMVSHTYYTVGTYTVTLTVTDNEGAVGQDTVLVNVVDIPVLAYAFLDISFKVKNMGKRWKITATVNVKNNDETGEPMAGVTVEAVWSGVVSGNVTGVTDELGNVIFATEKISSSGTASLLVTEVIQDGQSIPLTGEESDSVTN